MTPLAWLLLLLGALLWWLGRRWAAQTGVADEPIVAQDMDRGQRPQRPLFDRELGLTGRPDYLLQTPRGLVPVEVKPMRQAGRPYESDTLQLMAYCQLVEAETGQRPPYGVLIYARHRWEIAFTEERREQLVQTLSEMRADLEAVEVARSHEQPARCRACGVRAACDEALE
jgi:CRISPR-associated exonuclease Cas4